MAHSNEHHIKLLNSLIETTLDSVDGYREAAKDADKSQFKPLFESMAEQRQIVVRDLQAEVRRLGGEPEDDGTVLAAAHRVFVKLRDSLSKGDQGVIDEVERGEDFIKAKFEKARQDTDVEPQTKAAIDKGYASVKAGHDRVSALKHAHAG
ncbi:MAG: hypothetical protein JWP92_63 [Caulobacter sp.]|nr:hypothetical protein [Caulobacter sp.]